METIQSLDNKIEFLRGELKQSENIYVIAIIGLLIEEFTSIKESIIKEYDTPGKNQ